MATVSVTYEDETVLEAPASHWPQLRADGVQQFVVSCAGRSVSFAANSIYWLYPEGENIVAGCGSVRYDPNPLNEVVIEPDGKQSSRKIEFMPDLQHERVKLGWWKHG